MGQMIRPIVWEGGWQTGTVSMLDQRRLPADEVWLEMGDASAIADAIRALVIRGAPAIGIAAAMGMALTARNSSATTFETLREELQRASALLADARPTAVNLVWALQRMGERADACASAELETVGASLYAEAHKICEEDLEMNLAMGRHGLALMPAGARILTHCNTGALATGGYGTALGVIRACHERAERDDQPIHVWVDETRPYLQGARLTAWELQKEGIPATLITDSMAGFFMSRGEVDAVIIGSDRIAANGDVANKIGSYGLAVLAHYHGVPFYVAAPSSTVDPSTPAGRDIPIEERAADELTCVAGHRIAPQGVDVRHPAFDVTPSRLVTAIVTEAGVFRHPYSF